MADEEPKAGIAKKCGQETEGVVVGDGDCEEIENYSEENRDQKDPLKEVHPATGVGILSAIGQTFTTPMYIRYKLCKVKFYLARKWNPVGKLVARLYAHTGTYGSTGKPDDNPVDSNILAESDPVNFSSVPNGVINPPYHLIEFTFPEAEQYIMKKNTHYCIAVVVKSATLLNGGGQHMIVGLDQSSPTHDGNTFWYQGAVGWLGVGVGSDTIFYIYGIELRYDYGPCDSKLEEKISVKPIGDIERKE